MTAENPTDSEREKDYAAFGRVAFRVLPSLIEWVKKSLPALAIGFASGGGVGTVINKVMGRQPVTVEAVQSAVETAISPLVMRELAHEVNDSIYRDSVAKVAQNRPQPRRYGPRRVDHAVNTPPMLPLAQNQRRDL